MDNEKRLYRLWYEYLKRSDDYREFCNFTWERHKEKKSISIPEKFKRTDKGSHPFLGIYTKFVDVFRFPFEEWWPWKKQRLDTVKRNAKKRKPVKDYMGGPATIEKNLDFCIKHFQRVHDRDPSATELRDFFVQSLKDEEHRFLLLRVDLTYGITDIKKSFSDIICSDKVKKKISSAKKYCWWLYRNSKPTGKPRIEDLQRYLDVYDMWKAKVDSRVPGDPSGWDEIIQHFEPHRELNNESDRRLYQSYKQKAEKIISNVEKGYFPGKY